jgi:hypothetical protein
MSAGWPEVDGDDRAGRRGDGGRRPRRVEGQRVRLDVDQHRRRAGVDHDRDGGEEGEARHDDLVAGADLAGAPRGGERVGAARDAHAVLDLAVAGELRLEGADVGAEEEVHALEDGVELAAEGLPDRKVAGPEVDGTQAKSAPRRRSSVRSA